MIAVAAHCRFCRSLFVLILALLLFGVGCAAPTTIPALRIRSYVVTGENTFAFNVQTNETFLDTQVVSLSADTQILEILTTLDAQVQAVAANRERLVAIDVERNSKIVDLESGTERAGRVPDGVETDMVDMLANGKMVSAAIGGSTVWVWDPLSTDTRTFTTDLVLGLQAFENKVVVSNNLLVNEWDPTTDGKRVRARAQSAAQPVGRALSVLADGRLATANDTGTVTIWGENVDSPEVTLQAEGQIYDTFAETVQLADGRIAAGGYNGIHIWDTAEPQNPEHVLGDGKAPGRRGLVLLSNKKLATFFQNRFEYYLPESKGSE